MEFCAVITGAIPTPPAVHFHGVVPDPQVPPEFQVFDCFREFIGCEGKKVYLLNEATGHDRTVPESSSGSPAGSILNGPFCTVDPLADAMLLVAPEPPPVYIRFSLIVAAPVPGVM